MHDYNISHVSTQYMHHTDMSTWIIRKCFLKVALWLNVVLMTTGNAEWGGGGGTVEAAALLCSLLIQEAGKGAAGST